MRFGAYLGGDPLTTHHETCLLVERGFADIWFGEVPTVGWGDPLICMSQAASASQDVALGTAVTPAGLRLVPTLLTQLATVNRIAPGRVTVSYGSGLLSRRILGLPKLGLSDLRRELRLIRDLLAGREVAPWGDQPFKLHTTPRRTTDISEPIQMLVAAGGPRTAALAGEFGDGLIATGVFDPSRLAELGAAAQAAAKSVGRQAMPERFCVEVGPLCVVRDGEGLDSPRVVRMVQPVVASYFGYFAALGLSPDEVPSLGRDSYVAFLGWADDRYGTGPGRRMLGISGANYLGRVEEYDRFVTPDAICSCTLTGHASELADRLRDMERAGVTQVAILRAFDKPWMNNDELRELVHLIEIV